MNVSSESSGTSYIPLVPRGIAPPQWNNKIPRGRHFTGQAFRGTGPSTEFTLSVSKG